MRQLFGCLAAGLLVAAPSLSIGPGTVVAREGTMLPTVAQTPDTNPPGRDECRKLVAEAEVRTLAAEERNRLGLCLATHRDEPGPAAPGETEVGPLGNERSG